jgi:hypothetical protein
VKPSLLSFLEPGVGAGAVQPHKVAVTDTGSEGALLPPAGPPEKRSTDWNQASPEEGETQFQGGMDEDRDTRDRDGGSTSERIAGEGLLAARGVWARAAEQALRDMARAQRHAAAREEGTARTVIA